MSKQKKMLLIVEGEKADKKLFEKLLQEYELDLEYQLYSYKTNIYELYHRLFQNDEDWDTLDLLLTLKEKDKDNHILNEDYSDIVLVFDYDPQDSLYDDEKITKLLAYFNESTENGKLYLNYPMVESYKHFKTIPDPEFFNRTVSMNVLQEGKYKEQVGNETCIQHLRKVKRNDFDSIIIANIQKAIYISHARSDLNNKEAYQIYDDNILLKKQIESLHNNYVYVLNTSLFFIADYNFSLLSQKETM